MRGFSEGKSDVTKAQRPLIKPKIAIIFILCCKQFFYSIIKFGSKKYSPIINPIKIDKFNIAFFIPYLLNFINP